MPRMPHPGSEVPFLDDLLAFGDGAPSLDSKLELARTIRATSPDGGRQLDRVVSTAAALPSVATALGEGPEAYVDGGIRSGLDVVAALALGARAAFLGRLPLFALAAGGENLVVDVLETLRSELLEAMRLAGAPTLSALQDVVA